MSQHPVAVVVDAAPFAVRPASRAVERVSGGAPSALRRLMFWPAEFLRLLAVAYLFPLAVLAIGLPVALAVTGLLIAGQWLWQSVG
jgi:hypothetical protein